VPCGGRRACWVGAKPVSLGNASMCCCSATINQTLPPTNGRSTHPLLIPLVAGIIHGDMKPENVLLKTDEHCAAGARALVMDFGLSTMLKGSATHVSNYTSGTPFYIAPEVRPRWTAQAPCSMPT
jgi:serine/threonine protein kinase